VISVLTNYHFVLGSNPLLYSKAFGFHGLLGPKRYPGSSSSMDYKTLIELSSLYYIQTGYCMSLKPRLHYARFLVPYHFFGRGTKSGTGTNFIRAVPKIERSVHGA
jgi:hypothetical protein